MAEPREAASSSKCPAGPVRISEMLCDSESRLASLTIDPSQSISLGMHELGSPALLRWRFTPRKPPRGMAAPAAISARLFAGKRRPGEVGISSDCFLKATVSGSVSVLEDQRWVREPPFKA